MALFYKHNSSYATLSDYLSSLRKSSFFPSDFTKKQTLPTIATWLSYNFNKGVSNTPHNESCKVPLNQVNFQTQSEFQIYDADGDYKFVLVSQPAFKDICFIDWLSFTFNRTTFSDHYIGHRPDDIDFICVEQMYLVLHDVFGFVLGDKRPSGRNFYNNTYKILDSSGLDVGDLSIGGQANTIMVSITGSGLTLAKYGFQSKIFQFLSKAHRSKITRLDLAYDDFDGLHINVDLLNSLETGGLFSSFGRPPEVSLLGDWKYSDRFGKGRTFQLGSRRSDKMLRCYEKGRQLGDKSSNWTRLEVELKSKHTIIPFDAVLNPSDYFINLYPCFRKLFSTAPAVSSSRKIEYIKKAASISFDRAIFTLRHQYSKWIRFFREYYNDDSHFLNLIQSSDFIFPKKLHLYAVFQQNF